MTFAKYVLFDLDRLRCWPSCDELCLLMQLSLTNFSDNVK